METGCARRRAPVPFPRGGIHNLHQALANKLQEAEFAAKRDIISAAKTCEVTFVKADGSRRVMQVQAGAVRHHVKGNKATRSGRIASHTRAFRHPNLLPVWDTNAQAIRSVNLATVEQIVTRTETHTF
ncbi:MAG: hypothetical protein ABJ360_18445 [Roseobacter sp.]